MGSCGAGYAFQDLTGGVFFYRDRMLDRAVLWVWVATVFMFVFVALAKWATNLVMFILYEA
jgi:hypothetical protein